MPSIYASHAYKRFFPDLYLAAVDRFLPVNNLTHPSKYLPGKNHLSNCSIAIERLEASSPVVH